MTPTPFQLEMTRHAVAWWPPKMRHHWYAYADRMALAGMSWEEAQYEAAREVLRLTIAWLKAHPGLRLPCVPPRDGAPLPGTFVEVSVVGPDGIPYTSSVRADFAERYGPEGLSDPELYPVIGGYQQGPYLILNQSYIDSIVEHRRLWDAAPSLDLKNVKIPAIQRGFRSSKWVEAKPVAPKAAPKARARKRPSKKHSPHVKDMFGNAGYEHDNG